MRFATTGCAATDCSRRMFALAATSWISSSGADVASSWSRSRRKADTSSASRSRWSDRRRCVASSIAAARVARVASGALRARGRVRGCRSSRPARRTRSARLVRAARTLGAGPRGSGPNQYLVAATQAALYRRDRRRPPAVLVGGRATRARADEARPPTPSLPREVHPAARRGAARALRPSGRARARPVRRLGNDARAGSRVRVRRRRRRHRRVQLPADAREDRRVRRRSPGEGAA